MLGGSCGRMGQWEIGKHSRDIARVGVHRRREAPLSVLPDISPARGEIGSSGAGFSLTTLEIGESLRDI